MAKGFESKSVEDQQEAAAASAKKTAAHADHREDGHKKRRRQELELQRERVLSERTASPHRRAALAAALEDIEAKLSELGWTIHM